MRIIELKFTDHVRHWRLELMTFKALTLLVGASGVGKTQILKSILTLRRISKGEAVNGVEWSIRFSIAGEGEFLWEGKFDKKPIDADTLIWERYRRLEEEEDPDASPILYEHLFRDGNKLISRDDNSIEFEGKPIIKLPKQESVISLLKEEELVSPVHMGFNRIVFHDNSLPGLRFRPSNAPRKINKYASLEAIRQSNEDMRMKLFLAYRNAPDVFKIIKQSFIEVFPFVEDVRIEPTESLELPSIFEDMPIIQIKENGITEWIEEYVISSGMLRSLFHICEIHLCANGTVILVDEFENSLGVNCIEEVTSQIQSHNRDIQFIITSHHPYIINNINPKNWKLVTRRAGVVTAVDADRYIKGKSKHESFTQLINLDPYIEGVGA